MAVLLLIFCFAVLAVVYGLNRQNAVTVKNHGSWDR